MNFLAIIVVFLLNIAWIVFVIWLIVTILRAMGVIA